jgi:high affinity Mn2+ porin
MRLLKTGAMGMGRFLFGSAALMTVALSDSARSADFPIAMGVKSPEAAAAGDWSVFYVGADVGLASGRSNWRAIEPGRAPNLSGSFDLFRTFDAFDGSGSLVGGLHAGYNYMFPSRLLLGVETDVWFPGTLDGGQNFSSPVVGAANYNDTIEMSGTVRARVGYDINRWLYYVTGGFAWTYDQFTRTQLSDSPIGSAAGTVETSFLGRVGWTAGAGVEAPIAPGWTARFEYLYSQYGNTSVTFPLGGQRFQSDLSTQEVRFGVNYQLGGDVSKWNVLTTPNPLESDGWSLHSQTTFAAQYAPRFRAPYGGANSLDPNTGRETWDATLYLGRRLWDGAELWVNPEIDQGFGLSDTHGIAGFPNGNAYKVGATDPYLRLPRAFIRQTIDLGGETEKVASDLNQFAGSQSANRLVITVGKFAVWDWFDGNKYAHEPRSDFMNWALIDTATFDYAADSWGYTYGATAEWYQGPWTWRGCFCDLSIVPNSTELDPTFKEFQWIGEIEHRHELWGQPGKIIATGFLSRGRMGRFDDALNLAQLTDSTPDTSLVRRYGSRGGVGLSVEQQVSADLGVFARAGWADGNVEPYEFTDADRTVAAGLSLSGQRWGRPHDTFGLAGIVNGRISGIHAAYLDAGGLGILVGDGQLPHQARRRLLRLYTASRLGPGSRLWIISWLLTRVTTATGGQFRSSERVSTCNSKPAAPALRPQDRRAPRSP